MDTMSNFIEMAQESCDHFRSWHFFQESIRNNTSFPAVRCDSYDDFKRIEKDGRCYPDDIVYMGIAAAEK